MTVKTQAVGLYTLLRREVIRMFRISTQVFLPPVITTTLYFLIFGSLIGRRIGQINGVPYAEFIAPGLIMMTVITNAYGNVSSSLYSTRFQKSIEELLISPMHESLILVGYVLGGVIRGLIVATLVFLVSVFFVPHIQLDHLPLTLGVVILVASLFAMAGFTNAMLARNFDDVMLIPTFLLTPLTYLGGVFYSVTMLSPFWEKVSHFNPILYMVSALRFAMIGIGSIPLSLCLTVIILAIIFLATINMMMLKRGIGLRD